MMECSSLPKDLERRGMMYTKNRRQTDIEIESRPRQIAVSSIKGNLTRFEVAYVRARPARSFNLPLCAFDDVIPEGSITSSTLY